MKVLAIDTSSIVATCAIIDENKLIGEYIINHKRTHSQKIMPMIQELMSSCDLAPEAIDVYGVAKGPGSFTGLRIGMATIKALAHINNKPVVGVSTLDALAFNFPFSEGIIVPIMDARRDRVYTGTYKWDRGNFYILKEQDVMAVDTLLEDLQKRSERVLFNGDGVFTYRQKIIDALGDRALFSPASTNMARASSVAELTLARAKEGKTENFYSIVPDYIRKSQAEREYEERNQDDDGEKK